MSFPDIDNMTNAMETLLECAEKLFLQKNFEEVTVREIASEAGLNGAAVNYYFNSKLILYNAVLHRKLRALSGRIIEKITIDSNCHGLSCLNSLIANYVEHCFELFLSAEDGARLLGIIAREMSNNDFGKELVVKELVEPVNSAMVSAVANLSTELSREKICSCVDSLTAQIFYFMYMRKNLCAISEEVSGKDVVAQMSRHITEFSSQGFRSLCRV
jgi:AcrR family transcriptional regulator